MRQPRYRRHGREAVAGPRVRDELVQEHRAVAVPTAKDLCGVDIVFGLEQIEDRDAANGTESCQELGRGYRGRDSGTRHYQCCRPLAMLCSHRTHT